MKCGTKAFARKRKFAVWGQKKKVQGMIQRLEAVRQDADLLARIRSDVRYLEDRRSCIAHIDRARASGPISGYFLQVVDVPGARSLAEC